MDNWRGLLLETISPLISREVLSSEALFTSLVRSSLPKDAPLTKNAEQDGARILQSLLEEKAQRGKDLHGVVFTPPHATDRLLHNLFASDIQEVSLLDPACGGGTLLIAALIKATQDHRFQDATAASSFLHRSLFGIDRDPYAVLITRLALLRTLYELFPGSSQEIDTHYQHWKGNICCGNFLTLRAEDSAHDLDSLEISAVFNRKSKCFSHIIGNPPYGLSRNEQISPRELSHYKKNYAEFLSGKPNKYLLFLVRALSLLEEGGQLSFLLPNSWLGIASARRTRQVLLRKGYIRSIDIVEERTFIHHGVETVFLTLQKKGKASFVLRRYLAQEDRDPHQTITLSANEVRERSKEGHIPLFPSQEAQFQWRTIEENSQPLAESSLSLTPRIALQVYATGKGTPPQSKQVVAEHPFHESAPSTPHSHRYLNGKDVGRYTLSWPGSYLRYGEWIAEFQPLQYFSGPRIILREVLHRAPHLIMATYTEECFLYNRSLLHIIPSPGATYSSEESRETCLALLALLNSRVGSFVLQICGRKTNRRLFPKIVQADLSSFPIPKEFAAEKGELSTLALERLTAPEAQAPRIEEAIEQRVNALYGSPFPTFHKVSDTV
ncbi:N-6 DNA methylase [bacterium]|nr:N-6 DNA methylase [bacterium]